MKGRLRFPLIIEKDDLGYESGADKWHQDFSLRWSHYFGIFDVGLSYFRGNGREPVFTFGDTGIIQAYYPLIDQIGMDIQITHNAFLWKIESIFRTSDMENFYAFVAGLEYTFSNLNGNGLDIGILGEYSYDERDEMALSSLQNDFFFGSRIAWNDTNDSSILFGGIFDLKYDSMIFSIEAKRRIGNNLTAEMEARIFSNLDSKELILSNFKQDSFLRLAVSKYF